MTDEELMDTFIRFEPGNEHTGIFVKRISWRGPSEPHGEWIKVKILPVSTSKADLKRESKKILNYKRYFSVCSECNQRKPNGWMHDGGICQSCAERNHGVVY